MLGPFGWLKEADSDVLRGVGEVVLHEGGDACVKGQRADGGERNAADDFPWRVVEDEDVCGQQHKPAHALLLAMLCDEGCGLEREQLAVECARAQLPAQEPVHVILGGEFGHC